MRMLKRVFWFLLINILVITTISLIISIFNLNPHISRFGIDTYSLLFFCLIWGMGGSFISLLLSKKMAEWMMGIKKISSLTQKEEEKELLNLVKELSRKAGLEKTPEVGIYDSCEINAFATGPTKKNALIGVSSGLLNKMDSQEIKGVIAHEISHIANGDMVTMTLLQGIINAFVMFLARILAYAIASSGKNKENSNGFSYLSYHLFTMAFQTIFMIFGSMGICFFSRKREYRADRGGARLAGKEEMISALKKLMLLQEIKDPEATPQAAALNALKISNFSKKSLYLFATHPSLVDRIDRLKKESY
jgi:heat shock protein HtpX